MSQNNTLVNHMMQGKTISRLEALFTFRIQNITARIRDLRERGLNVRANIKTDANGSEYAEYLMNYNDRELAVFTGIVRRNPGGDFELNQRGA